LEDVDTAHGFLIVREGKNRKDRARQTSVAPPRPTRFATVARRTCCELARRSGIFRKCWAMPRSIPRRSIPE
jgi:hypothetical protein